MRIYSGLIGIIMMLTGNLVHADPFVDRVLVVEYGNLAGFGQDQFPDIVLGAPDGAGETGSSLDVLSLGDGGSIILEFVDNVAMNGPGPDIIVFENPFFVGGNPMNVFCEVAFVEASQDGVRFFRFPNDYDPDGDPIHNPANWSGFAGVRPVISNAENGIDPTDPELAGGDCFDLDDVGLEWIRYIRIIDTDEPPDAAMDDNGDEIYDQGMASDQKSGFDLDAIAAVHSEELMTPTPPEPTSPPTPTPEPTDTPIQVTDTPTQLPPPSPTSTEIPSPSDIMFDVILSQEMFCPDDSFTLDIQLWNPASVPRDVYLVLVLDAFGSYYYWPSWRAGFEAEPIQLDFGEYKQRAIAFIWPEGTGDADGLVFWGALFDEQGVLLGDIEQEQFGYREKRR